MKKLIKYPKQSKISKIIDTLVDETTIEYIKEFAGMLVFVTVAYIATVFFLCL